MITKVKYSEEELVVQLKAADQQAFSFLYDNYSRALYGVIKKVIIDDDVAQDVLQDVFVKIWNNCSKFDASKGRLFTWMLNIARNSSIDYLRSKQNKLDELSQRVENVAHVMDMNNFTETKVDHIGFRKVLDQLSIEQRKLIDLVYFEGYTQEEISNKLKIPLGTVKTRIRTALMALRKVLK